MGALGFGTAGPSVWSFGTGDKTKAGYPKGTGRLTYEFSMSSGATRRDRTGDLLITNFHVISYAIDSMIG